ncbi:MAG: ElyC/SanA/YdcF family protein [Verrucomicrobiota bacterium JB022]|nr:ElyC/SanA/YdcF family protein [Verrucomicrobiota bacterium JB022]
MGYKPRNGWWRAGRWLLVLGLLVFACLSAINLWIFFSTHERVYRELEAVPVAQTALVLGANPDGQFLPNRLQAGLDLYRAGKVQRLILSGAAQGKQYDEVAAMRAWMLERGVPAQALIDDPIGIRTAASIDNVQPLADAAEPLIIVSQAFHDYRALYLADAYEVHAVAYAAPEAEWRYRFFSEGREFLARVKAFAEVVGR